jgi:hypothetical protein
VTPDPHFLRPIYRESIHAFDACGSQNGYIYGDVVDHLFRKVAIGMAPASAHLSANEQTVEPHVEAGLGRWQGIHHNGQVPAAGQMIQGCENR